MSGIRRGPLFGIGGVTLLTVLLVLCLTMFAVLSFSAAQADYRLSTRNATVVAAFYEADRRAVEMMHLIEGAWPPSEPAPQRQVFESVLAGLGLSGDVEFFLEDAGMYIEAVLPVYAGSTLNLFLFLAQGQSVQGESAPGQGGQGERARGQVEQGQGAQGQGSRWQIMGWELLPIEQDLGDIMPLNVWMPDDLMIID